MLVLELAPIPAFVAATRLAAPPLLGLLGPLEGQVWIYHAGVSWSWAFIVLSRRAFAPDAPAIRIAPLEDATAAHIHRMMRRVTLLGAGGWLLAGMFYNLGLGFPPALTTVAISGTIVAAVLAVDIVRRAEKVRAGTAAFFGEPSEHGPLGRILIAASPALMGIYVFVAWAYWLAHWLETGVHRLYGPIGTVVVYLLLPILDRLGMELNQAVVPARHHDVDAAAERLSGCLARADRDPGDLRGGAPLGARSLAAGQGRGGADLGRHDLRHRASRCCSGTSSGA